MNNIMLTEEDFKRLVAGEVIHSELLGWNIALEDMGFVKMIKLILNAMDIKKTCFTREEITTENQKSFTPAQVDFICYQIGDWYFDWQDRMWVDGKPNQHWLGLAKEQLKTMICGNDEV